MTTMHERFDERFIPDTVKRYAGEIDVDKLALPMVPKEVKAFIQSEIDLAVAEAIKNERERTIRENDLLNYD